MSYILNKPWNSALIDRARIASIKIEENRYMGQRWVEFWIVFGRLDNPDDLNSFKQYINPNTGEIAKYIKLENGCHPLVSGRALGKCDTCEKWKSYINGDCDTPNCSGIIEPYDGLTRLITAITEGELSIFEEIKNISYGFLINEEIPDPITGELIKLLDARLK
jgi:hypothetical protein